MVDKIRELYGLVTFSDFYCRITRKYTADNTFSKLYYVASVTCGSSRLSIVCFRCSLLVVITISIHGAGVCFLI